jgi:chemotaxis signal transduction protein
MDCDSIVEIIPCVHLSKLASLPHYISGLLNYGGTPMPVIDISRILENRDSFHLMHTRIVIVKSAVYDLECLGLICEKATTISEIDKNDFKLPIIKTTNFSFLEGVCTVGRETLQFFNVDELLTKLKVEMGLDHPSVKNAGVK